ncbi:MAG: SOS response-associated peptidase [Actinobacteria bacterium]|nr:MAG: SOS response-associated peptidase [Actinomycetota bacterium]
MCGRFVAATPPSVLAERFMVDEIVVDDRPPSWNVAPTADVYAVARSRRGRRRLGTLRWGLVPSWADNPSGGARHINARAETVATNGVYRESFARRRCIVPADGFYEWQAPAEPGDTKQPYFIRAVDGQALALAGLWDSWRDAEGRWLRTCTIVTTGANDVVAPLHDRMPVVLPEEAWAGWLDASELDVRGARALLAPAPAGVLERHRVSTAVNSARNDGPELVEILPAERRG